MNRHLASIRTLIGRFRDSANGVAVVEFALVAPLLLLLYFGSVEASSLYTVDRRVTVISGTMGDLIGRWDPGLGAIPQAIFDNYFSAANVIMTPYSVTGLNQVVSFVHITPDGATKVLWSKATPGATARATNSTYPLAATTQMNQIARATTATGGWLVVSETSYSYKPVLGVVFKSALSLGHASYFLPRFGKCLQVATGGACS
ncbi:MAG: TadE/TadG family type IV pilus assembly protein [Devosia sp.]|nr:TadE/TadG family type IV pilus assembly protein [Devosia sp.]